MENGPDMKDIAAAEITSSQAEVLEPTPAQTTTAAHEGGSPDKLGQSLAESHYRMQNDRTNPLLEAYQRMPQQKSDTPAAEQVLVNPLEAAYNSQQVGEVLAAEPATTETANLDNMANAIARRGVYDLYQRLQTNPDGLNVVVEIQRIIAEANTAAGK